MVICNVNVVNRVRGQTSHLLVTTELSLLCQYSGLMARVDDRSDKDSLVGSRTTYLPSSCRATVLINYVSYSCSSAVSASRCRGTSSCSQNFRPTRNVRVLSAVHWRPRLRATSVQTQVPTLSNRDLSATRLDPEGPSRHTHEPMIVT